MNGIYMDFFIAQVIEKPGTRVTPASFVIVDKNLQLHYAIIPSTLTVFDELNRLNTQCGVSESHELKDANDDAAQDA